MMDNNNIIKKQLATILKSLTVEVNYFDHLASVPCSLWENLDPHIHVDANPLPKHPSWPSTCPVILGNRNNIGPPSRTVHVARPQKLLRNFLRNLAKNFRYQPGLQISQIYSKSDWASVGHVQTSIWPFKTYDGKGIWEIWIPFWHTNV